MALRINDLIHNASGREKEILRELKKLNKKAFNEYFLAPGYIFGHTFKMKYKALQASNLWNRAKDLLKEYKNDNICPICNKEQDEWLLHHDKYVNEEIFCPDFCMFIHKKCHSRIHKKY